MLCVKMSRRVGIKDCNIVLQWVVLFGGDIYLNVCYIICMYTVFHNQRKPEQNQDCDNCILQMCLQYIHG